MNTSPLRATDKNASHVFAFLPSNTARLVRCSTMAVTQGAPWLEDSYLPLSSLCSGMRAVTRIQKPTEAVDQVRRDAQNACPPRREVGYCRRSQRP